MSKYPGRIVTDLAPAGYSVFFDGTGDYLSIPNNAALQLSTGVNWCLEAWIYPTALSNTDNGIIGKRTTGAIEWQFAVKGTGAAAARELYIYNGSNDFFSGTKISGVNVWTHVAVSWDGTTLRFFINGSLCSTTHTSFSLPAASTNSVGIGANGNVEVFTGYISNARIVKGSAVYTASFTPPTQLFPIANTSLLTCQSPAIIDNSTNNFAITVNGNAAVSTFTPFPAYVPYNPALGASTPGVWTVDEAMQAAATRQWNMYDPNFPNTTLLLHGNPTNGTSFITDASTNNFTVTPVADARAANLSPFSLTTFATSGSGYFDGTGDYLTVANNTALQFGSGDFTIEFWWYPNATGDQNLISKWNSATEWILQWRSAGNFRWAANGAVVRDANYTLVTGTWIHVAVSCVSTNLRIFVNGTQIGTTATQSSITGTSEAVTIGAGQISSTPLAVNGYISNVRLVKGVGVYTGNFTTPTAPLTATQAAGTNISAITGTQTSLLTLQNSQSSNNNAFLDSSSNNFLITRVGNTTQGSFSPFSQTGWGVFFDGSTNGFINVLDAGSALDLPGDFTLEFWSYQNALATLNGTLNLMVSVDTLDRFQIYQDGTNLGFLMNGGGVITTTTRPAFNVWNHLAFVRSGTTVTFYLNGLAVATGSSSFSMTCTSMTIGGQNRTGATSPSVVYHGYNGYMSNFRLVKGTAVYTSNFTPSTTPLTAISGTSLLTCQSNRFVDVSSNALSISPIGSTAYAQPFSPFYPTAAYTLQTVGGSGFFDGTGDYLTVPDNPALEPAGNNFCIEISYYPTSVAGTRTLVGKRVNPSTDYGFLILADGANARVYISSANTSYDIVNGTIIGTLVPNQWHHIAVYRIGNAWYASFNASITTLNASNSSSVNNNAGGWGIGADSNGAAPIQGYMANTRFVIGSSVYTSTSAPFPTAPLTAITNTQLLLNFTNAGIVDSTGKNVFETSGEARISTVQSRFGGSSLFFDGTGDALYIPTPQKENLRFGTGDFTIEFWAWKSADGSTSYDAVIGVGSTGNYFGGFVVELSATRGFCFIYDGAVRISSNFNPNDSTWHHYAVVRSASTFALYRDGVQLTTATLTPTLGVTGEAWIGAGVTSTANNFNGYLDELRVTKGAARYTGAFTPQTSQWQDQ